jgi:hypothetical protein
MATRSDRLPPQPFRDSVHVVRLGDADGQTRRAGQPGQGRFALLNENLAYPPVDVSAEEMEVVWVVWKGGGFRLA